MIVATTRQWLVNNCITAVRHSGIPSKVRQRVIGGVAVGKMTALHAYWTWANKSLKNKPMDKPFAPPREFNTEMTAPVGRQLQWLPRVTYHCCQATSIANPDTLAASPDRAVVANTIARESQSSQVTVMYDFGKMGISHDIALANRVYCGQGLAWLQHARPVSFYTKEVGPCRPL